MADLRAALGAAVSPVLAAMILAIRKCRAVEIRSRQDVVTIRRVAAAIDLLAAFADRIFFAELVGVAMQVGDILRNLDAFGTDPGSATDQNYPTGVYVDYLR